MSQKNQTFVTSSNNSNKWNQTGGYKGKSMPHKPLLQNYPLESIPKGWISLNGEIAYIGVLMLSFGVTIGLVLRVLRAFTVSWLPLQSNATSAPARWWDVNLHGFWTSFASELGCQLVDSIHDIDITGTSFILSPCTICGNGRIDLWMTKLHSGMTRTIKNGQSQFVHHFDDPLLYFRGYKSRLRSTKIISSKIKNFQETTKTKLQVSVVDFTIWTCQLWSDFYTTEIVFSSSFYRCV